MADAQAPSGGPAALGDPLRSTGAAGPASAAALTPLVLVFDLMDTLVADPYMEALEAATGMPFSQFEQMRPHGVYHALERGQIDEHEYWEALTAAGIEIDRDRFHSVRRARYRWTPGMHTVLEQATALHRVLIATNYPAGWVDEIERRFLSRFRLEVCASCQLGVRKPARRFYEAMAERFALRPDRTVLVDDSPGNVAGAHAAGWMAVPFHSADQLRAALEEHGCTLATYVAEPDGIAREQPIANRDIDHPGLNGADHAVS